MWRHRSRGAVTTAVDDLDQLRERRIQRLRLTLHAGDQHETKTASTNTGGSENSPAQDGTQRPVSATQDGKAPAELSSRRNGYVQAERPAGAEAKVLTLAAVANGVSEKSPQRKSQVHGGVQQGDTNLQQEAMVHEWSVNHLRDEMNYIKDVRNSLEKLRERMYGQFGGMQHSVQKLSQDIRAANVQRQDLEAQVKVRTAAMESLDQMNSSLLSANISLQKSLLENCLQRVEKQDELKSLRSSWQRAEAQLRERDQQLAAARAENLNLRLQVESSQEATSQALQEMSQKLQSQYEEQLKAEQQKHREEIEALQAQIDQYVSRLEEAEGNVRLAEAKIAERDQRISEVERLLDCMGQEKSQLMEKLQDCEEQIHILEQTDHVDEAILNKSEQLESEAAELKERIKHLNDMVFCQQRKVKAMIEEVEMLRATVVQKDLFITELLDRIAMADCENKSKPVVETRDVGVSCDLPIRRFLQSLPDKGKKISDSVERLRLAVAKHEEEDKKKNALLAVRAEFQSQYQRALTQRQSGSCSRTQAPVLSEISHKPTEAVNMASEVVPGLEALCTGRLHGISADELNSTPNGVATAPLDIDTSTDARTLMGSGEAKEKDLAEALERVTLSDDSDGSSLSENARSNDGIVDNPFWGSQSCRKPHCIEILEKTEMNSLTRKPKFKPNQLIQKTENSSTGSSSPDRSPGGTFSHSVLSVEARRQRDRKHLDEITAARLPPLHHNPAMLLTLEESAALQREQARKFEELQAKLAAQRLSERLGMSMGSYSPEGEMQGRYREVMEDPSEHSSEED
ncbi:protein GRINL1A [Scleropages formosus]|uniref:protein GRINL1A n=1 Tax=Scleropages formosus TaxID=113540 RepID=UPI0010FAC42B|nr:myocardial zonula adherens protein-like [Scleropages formosus]